MAKDVPPELAVARVATQFKPGQGGRPKGARNKLSESFIHALAESFEAKGAEAINRVIDERPQDYLNVIAKILPKEVTGEDGAPLFSGVTVQFVKADKK